MWFRGLNYFDFLPRKDTDLHGFTRIRLKNLVLLLGFHPCVSVWFRGLNYFDFDRIYSLFRGDSTDAPPHALYFQSIFVVVVSV